MGRVTGVAGSRQPAGAKPMSERHEDGAVTGAGGEPARAGMPAMLRAGVDHAGLDRKYEALRESCARFLGYPVNLKHDCSELARFY